ncbi:hypothetical protein ACQ33O_01165 [Ferruginibacter sp. SUN002]|uniref:hypothetical protein n=1 Tax=Ferruginibacter sp. SUN002 TaxID=2937789 RepID=UPI003D35D292
MAKIKIQRSNELINRFRDYRIYLDGKELGVIANGQNKEFEIESGSHEMISKIDWASSNVVAFDIKDEEMKSFYISGYKNSSWLMPISIIAFIIYLIIEKITGYWYAIFLFVPPFLLLIYYTTIGKKRYLRLFEK